jgi:quercetin dioxygenase-like cupin family protein
MSFKPATATQYGPHPALPSCAAIAVQDGDPATGNAIIALKAAPGCVIPWHWHTGNERLIIVSGSGKAGMKGMDAASFHKGDFILMPGKTPHQFTAESEVELYIVTDAPFDIHYIDSAGQEITPDQALKRTSGL